MERNEIVRWFAKPQILKRSIVCGYVLTLGARVKCCPKETANLPPRCSSMRWKSSAARRQWWKKVRGVLYQSSGEAEDTVQRIESLTRTRTRVLREKLGRKVDSKSIASSRPDGQVVLSQPEKRDGGHGTRSREKGKEYDGPLAQVGETRRSKAV